MLDPDVTNTAQAEMVGRLLVMYSHRGDGIPTQYVNPNGPEAAAEIERTAGEVAALREALEDANIARQPATNGAHSPDWPTHVGKKCCCTGARQ